MHVTAMIPARLGSERLARKNLQLLNGRPLIRAAVELAVRTQAFDRIYVNTESPELYDAACPGVDGEVDAFWYRRNPALARSNARSDDVVADFLRNVETDAVCWLNPIAPLQPTAEVRAIVEHFRRHQPPCLMTVRREQAHFFYADRPLNFDLERKFERTQDLTPVVRLTYGCMIWQRTAFMNAYNTVGRAFVLPGMRCYPVSVRSGILVKTAEDLALCAAVLRGEREESRTENAY